jgi:uncharacterized protein with ParB-like and HNH nuclease domain
MDVKKKDFEEIFKNRTFEIPIYQRGYDWKKLNRDTFWSDLKYHIEEDKTLFLGTIILNDFDKTQEINHPDARGVFNHSVVDGQQRFTTMTILFVALRETLKNRQESGEDLQGLDKRVKRLIEGIVSKFLVLEDIDYEVIRSRFYGSSYKSKIIKNGLAYITDPEWDGLFPREPVQVLGKERRLTMEFNRFNQVYNDFYSKLNEKDSDGRYVLGVEYLMKINNKLASAEFIEIVVSDDSEAILLFENVNARGKELETSDLLKNHFFKEVPKWNLVEKDWDIIVENSEKSGGISRLLKYFYVSTMGFGGSSPPQKLYENLKSLGENRELELLRQIKEFSSFYKEINTGTEEEFLKEINFDLYGNSLSREPINRRDIFTSIELLRAINVNQPQPMIFSFFKTFLKLAHDGVSTTDEYNKIKRYPGIFLRQLEHFHYVNNGVGERRANDTDVLYQTTAGNFHKCDSLQDFQNVLKDFYSSLKKQRDQRDIFILNFCNKLYYNSGSIIDRMINYTFHMLERERQTQGLFTKIFPSSKNTDVSRDHWADQNDTHDMEYEEIRGKILTDIDAISGLSKIDSIGNLLPMSAALNASLGNINPKSPHAKAQELVARDEYGQYSIQKYFIEKYEENFETRNSDDIDRRTKDMANEVFDIIERTLPNI